MTNRDDFDDYGNLRSWQPPKPSVRECGCETNVRHWGNRMAKYIAHNGMEETEIEADAVSVFADDGTKVELQFRKSDGDISLSVNGTMLITPIASNMVRIARIK